MKQAALQHAALQHAGGAECEMRRTLAATADAAEKFFAEVQAFVDVQVPLNRADRFSVELLLRETLTNAVVHGCHADSAKQIRCFLRIQRRRLLLAVEDDGDGFDWRAAWGKSADLADCGGREIEILRKYASRVRYNAKGNAVAILKRFCEERACEQKGL